MTYILFFYILYYVIFLFFLLLTQLSCHYISQHIEFLVYQAQLATLIQG